MDRVFLFVIISGLAALVAAFLLVFGYIVNRRPKLTPYRLLILTPLSVGF